MVRERGKVRHDTETSNVSGIEVIGKYTSPRQVSKTFIAQKNPPVYEGRVELDTHADTFVAGRNCLLMNYTEKVCDVAPYSDEYEPKKAVPIVQAATGYTNVTDQSCKSCYTIALGNVQR